jgi:hypothetical protein
VRGTAFAVCHLDAAAKAALSALIEGSEARARFRTITSIDGEGAPGAAAGEFEWVVRLAPS